MWWTLGVVALLLAGAGAHPQYLDQLPNGHNPYFNSLPGQSSDGAIGHSDDRGGAHLNQFGHDYGGGDTWYASWSTGGHLFSFAKDLQAVKVRRAVTQFQSCHADDVERVWENQVDDDDDDHHHHRGPEWSIKYCCKDSDRDGQYNGLELGDPCCAFKKGRKVAVAEGISHPGEAQLKTKNGGCAAKPTICGRAPPSPSPPAPHPPPSPPGPSPAPTPGIPASCQKALNFVCAKAKTTGAGDCLLCAGEHSVVLKAERCTEANFKAYCDSSPSPTPPTPPTPPAPTPPAPVIHCDPHSVPIERCPGGTACPNCSAPVPPGCACPAGPTPPAPTNTSWVTEHGKDCFSGQDSMGECSSDDVATCKQQCLNMTDPPCGGFNMPHKHFKPVGCYLNMAPDAKLTLYAIKLSAATNSAPRSLRQAQIQPTLAAAPVRVTAATVAPRRVMLAVQEQEPETGPLLYVQGRNARMILAAAGWSITDAPEVADVLWLINRCYLGAFEPRLPQQALNMLPWDLPLVDKAQLAKNIQRYDQERGVTDPLGLSKSFLPTTYRVADEAAWVAFRNETAACARTNSNSGGGHGTCGPWILKRTDLSNGEGAQILPDPARWAAQSGERERLIEQGLASEYIVQRYIDKPLLLDGRKSELRTYWLVASLEPLVVLYHPGTVRLNIQAYRRDEYDNDLIHITNTRRQLQSVALNATQRANHGASLGLKWTHEQLRADLMERGYGSDSWERLQHTIRQILIRTVNATVYELTDRVGEARGTFQLFGADFVVDDELQPWLTEVQVGPGLSHDEPVKASIIPALVADAAAIGLAASRATLLEGQDRIATMARLGAGTAFQPLINHAA